MIIICFEDSDKIYIFARIFPKYEIFVEIGMRIRGFLGEEFSPKGICKRTSMKKNLVFFFYLFFQNVLRLLIK